MGNKPSRGTPKGGREAAKAAAPLSKEQCSLLLRVIERLIPRDGYLHLERPAGFLTDVQAEALLAQFSTDGGHSLGQSEVDQVVQEILKPLGLRGNLDMQTRIMQHGFWGLDADRDGRLSLQDLTGSWFLTKESAREVVAEGTGFDAPLVDNILGYLGSWSRWENSVAVDASWKPGAPAQGQWAAIDFHTFPHLELHPHPHNVPRDVDIVHGVFRAGVVHMPAHIGHVIQPPGDLQDALRLPHFIGNEAAGDDRHAGRGLLYGYRMGVEAPTQMFVGHTRPVRAFADIGNAAHPFVISSAGDGTMRIWPFNTLDPTVDPLRTIRTSPAGAPSSQMATSLCRLAGLNDYTWASGHLDGSVRLWSYPELTDSRGLLRAVWLRMRQLLKRDPALLELALQLLLEGRRRLSPDCNPMGDPQQAKLAEEAQEEFKQLAQRATYHWARGVLRQDAFRMFNARDQAEEQKDQLPDKVQVVLPLLDAGHWSAAFGEDSQLGFGSLEEALGALEDVCKTDADLRSRLGEPGAPPVDPNAYDLTEVDFLGSQFLFNPHDPFLQRNYNPFPEVRQLLLEDQPPAPGQPVNPVEAEEWRLRPAPGTQLNFANHPYNNHVRLDVRLPGNPGVAGIAARDIHLRRNFGPRNRRDRWERAYPEIDLESNSDSSSDAHSEDLYRRNSTSTSMSRAEIQAVEAVEAAEEAEQRRQLLAQVDEVLAIAAQVADGPDARVDVVAEAAALRNMVRQLAGGAGGAGQPQGAAAAVAAVEAAETVEAADPEEAAGPGEEALGPEAGPAADEVVGPALAVDLPEGPEAAIAAALAGPGEDANAAVADPPRRISLSLSLQQQQEEEAEAHWACPMCTLLNRPDALRCEVCDFQRPHEPHRVRFEEPAQQPGEEAAPVWLPRPLAAIQGNRRVYSGRLLDLLARPIDRHSLFLAPLGPGHLVQAAPGLRCWAEDPEGVWRAAVITAVMRDRELVQVHYIGTFTEEWIDGRMEGFRLRDPNLPKPEMERPQSPFRSAKQEIVQQARDLQKALDKAQAEFVEVEHRSLRSVREIMQRQDTDSDEEKAFHAEEPAPKTTQRKVCGNARRAMFARGAEDDDEAKEQVKPDSEDAENCKKAIEAELAQLDPETPLGRRVFRLLLQAVAPAQLQLLPPVPDGPVSVSCELRYHRRVAPVAAPRTQASVGGFPRTTEFAKLGSSSASLLALSHSHRSSLRIIDPIVGRPIFAFPELERAHAGAVISSLCQVGPTDDPDFVWLATGDRQGVICVWELPLTSRGAAAQRNGVCTQKRQWEARVAENQRLNRERRRAGEPMVRLELPEWRPTPRLPPAGPEAKEDDDSEEAKEAAEAGGMHAMREAVLLSRMVAVGPDNWHTMAADPGRRSGIAHQPVLSLRCTEEGLLMSTGPTGHIHLWDWRSGKYYCPLFTSSLPRDPVILGEQLSHMFLHGGLQVIRVAFKRRQLMCTVLG